MAWFNKTSIALNNFSRIFKGRFSLFWWWAFSFPNWIYHGQLMSIRCNSKRLTSKKHIIFNLYLRSLWSLLTKRSVDKSYSSRKITWWHSNNVGDGCWRQFMLMAILRWRWDDPLEILSLIGKSWKLFPHIFQKSDFRGTTQTVVWKFLHSRDLTLTYGLKIFA